MIAITGATGQLGRLVIQHLLKAAVPASRVVAVVRNPAKAADLTALGVQVRAGNYDDSASLVTAFAGVEQVLLISSSEVGKRLPQHKNVIQAAVQAKVGRLLYTSVLRADQTPLELASDHIATEKELKASGLRYAILRNGWYTENYAASIKPALALKAFYGSAGQGRISSAARTDYAEAAAKVLLDKNRVNVTYELAGDSSYTLAEFAAEVSRQVGQDIPYVDIPEAAYREALVKAGLPAPMAQLVAQSDSGASLGGLYDTGRTLSKLLGHATTPLATVVKAALA